MNFTNKFSKYSKEDTLLEMVRDFMDAVKVKIEEKHGHRYRSQILKSWHHQKNNELKSIKIPNGTNHKHQNFKIQINSETITPESAETKTPETSDLNIPMELPRSYTSRMTDDEKAAEIGTLSDVMNRLMESAIEQTILQVCL